MAPRAPAAPHRGSGARRPQCLLRMAARPGLGNGHPGARHDRWRVLPGRPLDGSAGGEGQDTLQTVGEEAGAVAHLGATNRLPGSGARDSRTRVRVLLVRSRRLEPRPTVTEALPNLVLGVT